MQANDHRRSMLPKKMTARQNLIHTEERQRPNPNCTSKARNMSMLPPDNLGRSRSVREPVSRTSQISRASSSASTRSLNFTKPSDDGNELVKLQSRPRTRSGAQEPQRTSKVSLHGRSLSQQVPATSAPRPCLLPPRSSTHVSMKDHRPVFSTLQQYYSPKKAMVASRPLDNPNEPDPATGHDFHLQLELAQLHIMHRSAATVQTQWEKSAQNSFQRRFDHLHARHTELKEIAHQQRTVLNQLALAEWCREEPTSRIAEKVHQLSRNMVDIQNLLDSEGKYTRVLEIFQSWFGQATSMQHSRKRGIYNAGPELAFIDGIGDGWKAEAMVLERELTYCFRELKGFGEVRSGSSIGRILFLYNSVVSNLLSELDLVQWIENEIMAQESTWVEEAITKLSSNVSNNIQS